MGPGKPGKSWNSALTFSKSGKSWKRLQVPENPGNLLNSSNKVFRMYIKRNDCKTLGRIDFEIVGVRGCKVKFGVLENSSES